MRVKIVRKMWNFTLLLAKTRGLREKIFLSALSTAHRLFTLLPGTFEVFTSRL